MKYSLAIITSLFLIFTSCSKEESEPPELNENEEMEMMNNEQDNNNTNENNTSTDNNNNNNNDDDDNSTNESTDDIVGWSELYTHREEIIKFAISADDALAISDGDGLTIVQNGNEQQYQSITYNAADRTFETDLRNISTMKYFSDYLYVGTADGHLIVFDDDLQYIGFPLAVKKLGRTRTYMYAIWESTPVDGETFFDGNTFSAIGFDFRDNEFSFVDAFCYDALSNNNVCSDYNLSDFAIPYQYQVPTMLDATRKTVLAIPNGNIRPIVNERSFTSSTLPFQELKEIQWFSHNQLGWQLMMLTDVGFWVYDWESNTGQHISIDNSALLSNDVEDMMLVHSFRNGSVNDDFVAFSNSPEPVLYHIDLNNNASWWYRSENSLLSNNQTIRHIDQNHSILPFLYIAQGKRIIKVDITSFNQ